MAEKTIIGIIGGTGKMGKWFRRFFEANGCKVLVSGRHTKLQPKELIGKSDLVIFSVPIGVTVKTIKKYARFASKGKALADFTSIKEEPLKAMLSGAKKGVEVFGMHPVFGPSAAGIKGEVVVLCPARGKKWLNWMKKLLRRKGARVKVCSAKKHDEMMAVVQGVTHFSTIPTGNALKKLKVGLNESLEFSSPIYKSRMILLGRIMAQDPELYADILLQNKKALKAIRQFMRSAQELERIISRKDRKAFIKFFKESANYFGAYRNKAQKHSDRLLEKLGELR
ncbi:MAG: prephenate dehydrogenase/arogenate dehydrogenase family protein [Candidatus Diapherotrites archaeon]